MSAWISFLGLLLNLKASCRLSEACWEKIDCVGHQTCGGWCRLMRPWLQDGARAVTWRNKCCGTAEQHTHEDLTRNHVINHTNKGIWLGREDVLKESQLELRSPSTSNISAPFRCHDNRQYSNKRFYFRLTTVSKMVAGWSWSYKKIKKHIKKRTLSNHDIRNSSPMRAAFCIFSLTIRFVFLSPAPRSGRLGSYLFIHAFKVPAVTLLLLRQQSAMMEWYPDILFALWKGEYFPFGA